MRVRKGYTFDDVLLVPKESCIPSRDLIDISTDLGKGVVLKVPFISANMKTVTDVNMARVVAGLGGLGLLHRFGSDRAVVDWFVEATRNATQYTRNIGVSIGVQKQDYAIAKAYKKAGVKIICVDVAHGDHKLAMDMVRYLRKISEDWLIIAGNIATAEGARRLRNCGADVIKCGIGPGSLCSTRIKTGNGVPQLTALSDVYEGVEGCKIIADGGIKESGDITKALCFSDAVMLGNLLAGTNEAPGLTVIVDGKLYKQYVGSSTHKTNYIEGVSGLVPFRGDVRQIFSELSGGLRSGMSYQGAYNLSELKKDPEFVQITSAGLTESHPHDVRYS